MKKIVSFVLCITMTLCVISAWAVESEKAIRTDITAEIDYTSIETYNVNGYTYVPVDVLSNYGFEVEYRDENTIDIKRIRYATPMFTRELWESSITEKTYADIINDGKQVYLDGVLANSVSTTDGTLMMIDELQKYGNFKWNEEKRKITISIFLRELHEDYHNAEGIVEISCDVANIYHWTWKDTNANYKGQVDENGVPDGIGLYEYDGGTTRISVLGYFKNGRPDGYIYRNMFRTVTKTYKNRWSNFIGYVDASKEIPVKIYMENKINDGNNFGAITIPFMTIGEWTGPEMLDPNPYQSGCYQEDGFYKDDYKYDYYSWKKAGEQTVKYIELPVYGERGKKADIRKNNSKVKEISEFTQYQNGEEVYYNGGIQTISDEWAEYDSVVFNSRLNGAGFYPFTIDVILNGQKVKYANAQMEGDRVLVPCRSLFEEIGATVEWDETEQKVIIAKEDKNIILQIDHNIMTVNDEEIELDTTAKLLSGKTYVPVRAITEALGATVEWNDELKDVIINM